MIGASTTCVAGGAVVVVVGATDDSALDAAGTDPPSDTICELAEAVAAA
jgi:hypothetical protein